MFGSRSRTAPSGYKDVRLLFHSLRTAQLLSSTIVGGIMIYFIYHLHHDHYSTPWTFFVVRFPFSTTKSFSHMPNHPHHSSQQSPSSQSPS